MSQRKTKKSRNWTDDETILLCEILADPTNSYLTTLETKALKKAPTREVFSAILDEFKKALLSNEFIERNVKNFSTKKPYSEIDMDIKRLQCKYNNIKTNWRNITDRQKRGSGLSPAKLPKWFMIINRALANKNEGLDDISSCPSETSIKTRDSESSDDHFIEIDHQINEENSYDQSEENEATHPDTVANTIVYVVRKTVCRPHEKKRKVRSHTLALSQLSASIDRLADVSAKRLKAEVNDRVALLKFRKEEAAANRQHEIDLARLYLRQNQNLPLNKCSRYSNNSYIHNQSLQWNVRNLSSTSQFSPSRPRNKSINQSAQYESSPPSMELHSQIHGRISSQSELTPDLSPEKLMKDTGNSPVHFKLQK